MELLKKSSDSRNSSVSVADLQDLWAKFRSLVGQAPSPEDFFNSPTGPFYDFPFSADSALLSVVEGREIAGNGLDCLHFECYSTTSESCRPGSSRQM